MFLQVFLTSEPKRQVHRVDIPLTHHGLIFCLKRDVVGARGGKTDRFFGFTASTSMLTNSAETPEGV